MRKTKSKFEFYVKVKFITNTQLVIYKYEVIIWRRLTKDVGLLY